MRRVFVAVCLIATIYAHHIEQNAFKVTIKSLEYTNIPPKYEINNFDSHRLLHPEEHPQKMVRVGTEAILNDYADKIFKNLQKLMVHDGFDPVEMPDMHAGFNYTLIITYFGDLYLTHGWLFDISTIHRGGDVVASYSSSNKFLEVTVPIAFDDMQFTYDYSASIMGLGPRGGISGKISNLNLELKIGFDVETLEFSLDEFYITNSGHIDFQFNGNILVDWLLNLLSEVATTLLKEVILLVVEGVVRGGVQSIIDTINDVVGGIINPTTPLPTSTPSALMLKYNMYN